MFATLAGGYPASPLPGLAATFSEARQRRASGLLAADAYEPTADAFVAEIVAEQVRAGLSIVSDGDVRWPEGLDGLAAGLLDGSLGPEAVVQAWSAVAGPAGTAGAIAKASLPGPWSYAAAAARSGGGSATSAGGRRATAARLADAVVACAEALAAAGCGLIELHEPAATSIGEDRAAWSELHATLADVAGRMPEGVHRSLVLADGAVDGAGHGPLADLPFESLLVDVLAGPDSWRLIASLPAHRGVICGVVDVHGERPRDDPEMMIWAATLAAEANERGVERVGIAPNGSLAARDRFTAKRKIERLGLAMRFLDYGPLTKVARAVEPDPATCGVRSLRALIASVSEAGLRVSA